MPLRKMLFVLVLLGVASAASAQTTPAPPAPSGTSDTPMFSAFGDFGWVHGSGSNGSVFSGGIIVETKPLTSGGRVGFMGDWGAFRFNGDNSYYGSFNGVYEAPICPYFNYMVGGGLAIENNYSETSKALQFLFGVEDKIDQKKDRTRVVLEFREVMFTPKNTIIEGGVRFNF